MSTVTSQPDQCTYQATNGGMYLCNGGRSSCINGNKFTSNSDSYNQFVIEAGRLKFYGFQQFLAVPDPVAGGKLEVVDTPTPSGAYALRCTANAPGTSTVNCYNINGALFTVYNDASSVPTFVVSGTPAPAGASPINFVLT